MLGRLGPPQLPLHAFPDGGVAAVAQGEQRLKESRPAFCLPPHLAPPPRTWRTQVLILAAGSALLCSARSPA